MATNTMTPYERETTINMNDEDDYALITTYQRTLITKLSKNPAAELVWKNGLGGAQFKIDADLLTFRTGRRQSNETPEQSAERMTKVRAARGAGVSSG